MCGPICSRRWFFLAQAAFFPLAFPALLLLPLLGARLCTGRMDREDFVDLPFIMIVAQPVWVVSSLFVAFALTQAARAGAGAFARKFARAKR
jgi:hypothetical protein